MSKVQKITATYAVVGNDGKERTSSSYIYVYVQAVDEVADVVDEPMVIFGRFIDRDMSQYGIYYDDSIHKRSSEYSSYLQSIMRRKSKCYQNKKCRKR